MPTFKTVACHTFATGASITNQDEVNSLFRTTGDLFNGSRLGIMVPTASRFLSRHSIYSAPDTRASSMLPSEEIAEHRDYFMRHLARISKRTLGVAKKRSELYLCGGFTNTEI
jgi:hypothetical protein